MFRIISLSEGSAYETLHAYVSGAMAPYFKSFVRESGKADRCDVAILIIFLTYFLFLTLHFLMFALTRDGDKMATSMEKKIAELEMGLLHLQQNIDIPGTGGIRFDIRLIFKLILLPVLFSLVSGGNIYLKSGTRYLPTLFLHHARG